MTNDQLLAAWKRKLPNVEPTDQELTAFALGVEVGQVELATQVALVEKCMVAMNENADKGEKAEAEVGRLVRKLALEREEFKAELDRLKAQPVQEPFCMHWVDRWGCNHYADKKEPHPENATPLYTAAPVQPAQPAPLTYALQAILDLSAGWDEHGSTGPKVPWSWESVGRMAMDYARAALRTGGAG